MRPQHLKSKALQRRFAIWRWIEESLFNALMMKAVGVISQAEFLLALGLHSALVFSLGAAWDLFFLLCFVLNFFTELNISNDFNVTHCPCRLVGTYLTQIGSSQFPTHKIMFSERKPASNKHFMQMDMP